MQRIGALLVALLACCGGCSSSVRVSDPPRTATEQFLLSGAAAQAVSQLSVESLSGRRVFIDTQYFAGAEQAFVIGELRAMLLHKGVQLMPERDMAEIVMEIRSGGVGVDRSDFLLGVPSILLRAGNEDGTDVPLATPEVALVKNIDQIGIASVAFVAYWRETGELVASSGPFIGVTRREDWWFFGLGRRTVGDIPPVEAAE